MIFKLQLVFLKRSLENVILDWSTKIAPNLVTVLLLPLCYLVTPKPVGRIAKAFFPGAKFTTQVFYSFLSALMCGKSRKHVFNTEVIFTRVEAAYAIILSDRNDLLWECSFDIICQIWPIRGYTSWYTGMGRLKKWLQASVRPCSPQFPPVLFSSSHFLNSVGWAISEPGTC